MPHFLYFTLLLLFLGDMVSGQGLSIPSSWLNPRMNHTRADLEALASGAAGQLTPKVGSVGTVPGYDDDQSTTLFAALALQDYHSGNGTYANFITRNMPTYAQSINFYGPNPYGVFNADSAYWSLAFYYAFRAYNNSLFLDLAKQAYDLTYQSFITTADAASASGAGRNVSFSPGSACRRLRFAGGVFQTREPADVTSISSNAVGVSAYLYELEPSNQTYHDAAQLALDFATSSLWNGTIVQYIWDPTQCSYAGDTRTPASAYFIEGLAVWANVTANASLTSFLDTVVPSVATFPTWTSDNGIIRGTYWLQQVYTRFPHVQVLPEETFAAILIRALTEARNRNPGTDLASYIDAFISVQNGPPTRKFVQLNGLLAFSKGANADLYSTAWVGQPPNGGALDLAGNLAALDLLNGAFVVAASNNGPSGGNSGGDSGTPARAVNVGAIIGGAVGGAVVLLGAFLTLVLFLRHRQRKRRVHEIPRPDVDPTHITIEPFLSPEMAHASELPLGSRGALVGGHAAMRTKQQRMIAPFVGAGVAAAGEPLESGASGTASGSRHEDGEATDSEDVPGLISAVNRLNTRLHTLLQAQGTIGTQHEGEEPPQYE
ncbi:hypothetical protein K488DRAFT_71243 [Vararia minispora EC-137]|uniref:Uncharacterized protein n=1 Tax=Vararia minispora EC-137 TaxID=1314806 RepID=A0ACB8QIL1_9AGAM|nr:hypothetical protein K488DRAFT_71243 [Vararia minispora EC-137]